MARTDTANQLEKLVAQLQDERKEHLDAIAEIDKTFERLGIEPDSKPRPGRPRKTTSKKTTTTKTTKRGRGRGRGRYSKTAEEFILDLLEREGELTTKEINERWKKAGRAGDAANTLSRMSSDGKIVRENIPNARGSKYRKA